MDSLNYKHFVIYQMIEELQKKLSRLVKDSAEWMDTRRRIETLQRDLGESP